MLGRRSGRPRKLVPAVGVIAAAVVASACGSAYTKHDFIARADAICASALRQTRSVPVPNIGQAAPQASQLSSYLDQLLPIVQSEFRLLRDLKRPPQDSRDHATLTRWLEALGQQVDTIRSLAAAAKRDDAQGVARAEATLSASPAGSLAASYGLTDCSAPGATVT